METLRQIIHPSALIPPESSNQSKNWRMRRPAIFGIFAVLLICVELFAVDLVGRRAPSLEAVKWITPNPPGKSELQNAVYIVEFWATWCGPCIKCTPKLIELTDKYAPKGVLFIGISKDRSVGPVKGFIREHKINFHIGMDNGTSRKYFCNAIPTAFVVDHTGKITWQGHPSSPHNELEAEIEKAVLRAGPVLLAGMELGPFEHLRGSLRGGKNFTGAYRELKSEVDDGQSQSGQMAKQIIKTIDEKITEQIEEAARLRQSDPAASFSLYYSIINRYRGAEPTKTAAEAWMEMKNDEKVRQELAADKLLKRADRLMARCKSCYSCASFTAGCPRCRKLNVFALARLESILSEICVEHGTTKVAEKARQQLKGFMHVSKAEKEK